MHKFYRTCIVLPGTFSSIMVVPGREGGCIPKPYVLENTVH